MTGPPDEPANPDDSRWRYEELGQPYITTMAFNAWAKGKAGRLEDGANVTTSASWPNCRAMAIDDKLKDALREVRHFSTTVRYPADGMAYVVAPIVHPDQDEPFEMAGKAYMNFFTLVLENGVWKVHKVGAMVPPSDLGKGAYSW